MKIFSCPADRERSQRLSFTPAHNCAAFDGVQKRRGCTLCDNRDTHQVQIRQSRHVFGLAFTFRFILARFEAGLCCESATLLTLVSPVYYGLRFRMIHLSLTVNDVM